MRRLERFLPRLSVSTTIAFRTASRFKSGSPIPIKTILSRVPACFSRYKNCSTISAALKFLARPSVPVLQNAQPIAQPAWHETQAVFRPALSVRSTVSTARASSVSICSFTVPSSAFSTADTRVDRSSAFSASEARSSALRFVIASNESTPFPIH